MDNPATHGTKTKSKKTQHKMKYIGPTKIKSKNISKLQKQYFTNVIKCKHKY
jgi:hypothetical protein